MAKSVAALKGLLKIEEKTLARLSDSVALMAHKEAKDVLKVMIKNKKADIKAYKEIIKSSEKCPAVKKKAAPAKKAKA